MKTNPNSKLIRAIRLESKSLPPLIRVYSYSFVARYSLSLSFCKDRLRAVIALLLLFAPMLNAEMLRMEASVEAMGSAYSIVAYDEDRYAMQAGVDAAFDEVRRLDALLSNYKPASELSKINQLAADHPVVVSRETFD